MGKERNNAECNNIWKLSFFLLMSDSLSKNGTPVIHRVSNKNTATAEELAQAEASGKTSMKNKGKGGKKCRFFKLYTYNILMSSSTFFSHAN